MTAALQTTITRLLGQMLEHCYDPDPRQDLDLADYQRTRMLAAAAKAYEAAADEILAPYGCTLLANGEIIRTDTTDDSVLDWDEEAVREELAVIDVSDVVEDFLPEG